MLKPIREELGFGEDIYESLDEAEIDVTVERVETARRQALPFDHFVIMANADAKSPETQTGPVKATSVVAEADNDVQMADEVSNTMEVASPRLPMTQFSDNLAI